MRMRPQSFIFSIRKKSCDEGLKCDLWKRDTKTVNCIKWDQESGSHGFMTITFVVIHHNVIVMNVSLL